MKQSIQISTLIIFTFLVVFPLQAFPRSKYPSKTAGTLSLTVAGTLNGKLICEKMGGTFEIDQKDILDIKGITIERSLKQVPEEKTGQEAASGQKAPVKPEADLKGTEKQPQGEL